jgi:hypothetical protein
MAKSLEQKEEDFLLPAPIDVTEQQHMPKFPRTCSITQLLDMDYLGPISQLLSDNSYNSAFDFQNIMGNIDEKPKLGEMPYQYMMDSGKFQVNQGSILSQPILLNPVYDMPGFDR